MESVDNKKVSLKSAMKFSRDHIKTVLNLSTGALVLSITFLHEIIGIGSEHGARRLQHGGLLGISWFGFLLSVFGCLFYLSFSRLGFEWKKRLLRATEGRRTGRCGRVLLRADFFRGLWLVKSGVILPRLATSSLSVCLPSGK